MKHGFTLVELSIVLVIIGLLISAILVGQSLIESSQNNNFIRQIQGYDIAVSAFQQKFKGLPGDSSKFGCTNSVNICNNGVIQASDGGGFQAFTGETANFWKSLYDAGLISKVYSNNASAGMVMGTHMPKIDIGLGTAVIAGNNNSGFLGVHPNKNVYAAAYFNNANTVFGFGSTTVRPSLKPTTAISIDQKIDDGNAYTGNVMGLGGRYSPVYNGIGPGRSPFLYAPNTSVDNCATPTNYSTHSNESCGLSIIILSQTGQN
jgi:prepilin-type N-terminal cleavage/methylation domain-containing protein